MNLRRHYENTPPEGLILRDWLALDRTFLANERTLLAYLRTALGLLAAGAGLVHFFDETFTYVAGWILIGLSPLVILVAAIRFVSVQGRLHAIGQALTPIADDAASD